MRLKTIFLLIIFFSISFAQTNDYVKIAVLDITSRTKIENIDRNFLVERLQIELLKYKGIKVVERLELKRIMDEHKIQLSGYSEKDAVKIGSIIGANKIITGSLTEVDGTYFLIIKVIDVTTSEIDFIDQIRGDSTIELSEKIKNIVSKIANALLKLNTTYSEPSYEENKTTNIIKNENIELKNYEAKKFWTPIAIGFVNPLQLPSEEFEIYGGAFSLIYGKYSRVYGIFFSYIISDADKMYGIQYSFLNYNNELFGMQYGLVNLSQKRTFGVQAGLFNQSEFITGVQVGLINIAHKMVGVQVGLVNIINTGFVPVMLGINMSF